MSSGVTAILLSLSLVGAADERIVCVPKADASGWDCGKGANAPTPRALPRLPTVNKPTPPPYLVDPARLSSNLRDSGSYRPPANVVVAPAPRAVPPVAPPSPPIAEPLAKAPDRPAPAPLPPAAPPDVDRPLVKSPAPVAALPAKAETIAAAAPIAPVSAPPPPVAQKSTAGRTNADFLALSGSAYTVQLAAARNADGFAEIVRSLSLSATDTFTIRVRRGDEMWWLLLWRDFADLQSARNAAAGLTGSFWPRRLAPLQAELRASSP